MLAPRRPFPVAGGNMSRPRKKLSPEEVARVLVQLAERYGMEFDQDAFVNQMALLLWYAVQDDLVRIPRKPGISKLLDASKATERKRRQRAKKKGWTPLQKAKAAALIAALLNKRDN
jgi:hypothetical protein